jgi:predicted O-methyltransferase YrrM
MKITVFTPTGDRPDAFRLCEKWMARQTVQPHEWLVFDDGVVPTRCTMGQTVVRCQELAGRGSLASKLARAVNLATGDALAVVEDDDWYAATWLEWCAVKLASTAVVGEGFAWYFNLAGRWFHPHSNMSHASLCSTAFRRDAFPLVSAACEDDNPFIDVRLWEAARKAVVGEVFAPEDGRHVIGMKAMPGRAGYGWGHRQDHPGQQDDHEMRALACMVGSDVVEYERLSSMKQHDHAHGKNWRAWLGDIAGQPDIAGLEIGTYKGESAEWMLTNIFTDPSSRYVCVDHFEGSVEHHIGGMDCGPLEGMARARLAPFRNVDVHRAKSAAFLRSLSGEQFEFIYVDAAHDAANVLRDAVLAWDLLMLGGVMVFDDYEWNVMPTEVECPKLAIDAFLECYVQQIEVLAKGWQVAVRKIREG